MKTRYKLLLMLLVIVASFVLYRYLAYRSTDSIETDFLDVVTFNEKPNIDYGELKTYQYTTHGDVKVETVSAKLERYFVYHNFNRGMLGANYTITLEGAQGNRLDHFEVDAEWRIKKKNGRWVVYEIDETPYMR